MAFEATLAVALLLGLLVFGVPIAVALGLSGAVGLWLMDFPLLIVIQRLSAGTESFVLLAIPFFILSGAIMETGGMSRRLVEFADSLVGFLPGGLANANIGASMVFGGISGSAVADTSAVGSVMIPQMERQGYSQLFSASVTAASSPIGMIIPPSIPMIVWSFVSGLSLNQLFLAGLLPGILIGVVLMAISTAICVRRGYQARFGRFSLGRLGKSGRDGLLALGAPAIIIGGTVSGEFTPAEASVVAVFYALLVTMGIYRELSWRELPRILTTAGKMAASIMFVVAAATVFSFFLTVAGLPQMVGQAFQQLVASPGVFVLVASALLFVCGMFLDTTTTILMIGPILYPLIGHYGLDPLTVSMVFLIVLAVGLVTPPVGLCLFVVATLVPVRVMEVARECVPFVFGMLAVAAAIWAMPGLATWGRG